MTRQDPDKLCPACLKFDYDMNRRDGICPDILVSCIHDEEEDEDISKYTNEFFCETAIRQLEDDILGIMKYRQEKYPSEINDSEWLNFSNQVIRRKCERMNHHEKQDS